MIRAIETQRIAISYLRFSDQEQMEGDSQRRQTSEAERGCLQFGWVLNTTLSFRDLGVSAYRGRNRLKGNLSRFLALLEAGKVPQGAVLILEDFDRLSRDKIDDSYNLVREILRAGVDIFCTLNWKLYTRDSLNEPMSIMEMIWRFYLAHEESKKKSFRSKENWKAKHDDALKKIMTRLCPAWLRVEDERFVEIPERVAVIKLIFGWCIAGMGIKRIGQRLIAEGVPAFRSNWGQKYIWQILNDRRVLGDHTTCQYGEEVTKAEVIKGYYHPVIEESTYWEAQNAQRGRKLRRGRPGAGFVNLFTGLVYYPAHGPENKMVMVRKPSHGYDYRYLVSYAGFIGTQPTVTVPYEALEATVLKYLWEIQSEDVTVTEGGEEDAIDTELRFVNGRIAELAGQLKLIGVNIPSVVQTLAELEKRKTTLEMAISERARTSVLPSARETQDLCQLLATTEGDELMALRERIKQRLLYTIQRIDVEVLQAGRRGGNLRVPDRDCRFHVHFVGGCRRSLFYRIERGVVEDGLLIPEGKNVNAAFTGLYVGV